MACAPPWPEEPHKQPHTMATFPHNLCGIRQDGHAEQHAPVVLRSEVERGTPRQRRTSADALVSVPCTLVFRSAAAAAEFEAWYYAEGSGWFDFTLPRTGAVVRARIVGGDIGGLTPITPAWNASERTLTLEYIRPGFVTLAPGLHTVSAARILSAQRNSTATYIDDAGVLQTAAANVVRYEGGQVLVEGEATNSALYSSLPSDVAWGAFGLTKGAPAATDYGADAAVAFLETTANASHYTTFGSVALTAGQRYVLSVFASEVPAGLKRYLSILVESSAWGAYAGRAFDIGAGVAGAAYGTVPDFGVIPVAGGVRIWIAYTAATTGSAGAQLRLSTTNVTGLGAHVGDVASGMVLWGRQIEAKDIGGPSAYIPTTTATATRAADLITVAA